MTLLGVFLGLIFGVAAGGFSGAFWGALLGGVGGYALKTLISGSAETAIAKPRRPQGRAITLADKVAQLEERIEALEATQAQPARLTSGVAPSTSKAVDTAAYKPADVSQIHRPLSSPTAPSVAPPAGAEGSEPGVAAAAAAAIGAVVPAAAGAPAPAALAPSTTQTTPADLAPQSPLASPAPQPPALPPLVFEPIAASTAAIPPPLVPPLVPPLAPPLAPSTRPGSTSAESAPQASMRNDPPLRAPYVQVPATPPEPTLASRVWEWATTGNLIAKVGAIILFMGVAYLLRYASQHISVPPVFRVAGVGAGALALLALGWWLRKKRESYALLLQGAGVGLLYLTLYGAMALYQMIAPATAFTLLAAVSLGTAWVAVLQRSQVLAGFGVAGGFLAPVLASTGHNQYVALFGYYLVLNVVILTVAWFQAWRALNLLGFLFTFVIALVWGTHYYQPQYLATTLPFAVGFYAMYLAVSVLFGLRTAKQNAAQMPGSKLAQVVDGTLVFGVPALGLAVFAGLLADVQYGLSSASVTLALVYAVLAFAMHRNKHAGALTQSFTLLAIVFSTIAVPLGMDASWAAAVWAAEGAGVLWLSLKQRHKLGAFLGLLLQVGAVLAYAVSQPTRDMPILNPAFAGALLIAAAAMFSSWQLGRFADAHRQSTWASLADVVSLVWLLLGVAAWAYAADGEISAYVLADYRHAAQLIFVALSVVAFAVAARATRWQRMHYVLLLYVPYLIVTVLFAMIDQRLELAGVGIAAWGVALAVAAWQWWQAPRDLSTKDLGTARALWVWQLPAMGWLVALLGTNDGMQLVGEFGARHTGWAWAAPVVVAALLALASHFVTRTHAGLATRAWRVGYQWPVAAALTLWVFFACFTAKHGAHPLAYLPVLNPLELTIIIGFCVFIGALRTLPLAAADLRRVLTTVWSVLGFIAVSTAAMRMAHQYTGVRYELNAMLASTLTQSALSLMWTATAMALMIVATRKTARGLWMVGAALLAVVAGKLLLVDLGNRATIEGIAAMIGVGALFMAIGYFSPLPPKATAGHESAA